MAANPAYQQKLQEATVAYNRMKEQFSKTQTAEKQLKDWEKHLSQLKECIPSNSQRGSTVVYEEIIREIDESKRKLFTLVPKNANVPSYFNKSSAQTIQDLVHGIRLLLSRRQVLTNSIEFLQKEAKSLSSEIDDLQNQLVDDRIWVNEKEEELTKENQEARLEFNELIKSIQDDQTKHDKEIKKLSDKANEDKIQSNELDFLTDQTQKQIDSLLEEISKSVSSMPSENQQLIIDMLNSIKSLKERADQTNEIIKATKYLNVINNGTKILNDKANELAHEYNIQKKNVQLLVTKDLPSHISDYKEILEILEEQTKELNDRQKETIGKEQEKQKLLDQIEKVKNERMGLLVSKEKADNSSLFAKSFREVTDQITKEDEHIKDQKEEINLYKNLCNTFVSDNKQLKDIIQKGKSGKTDELAQSSRKLLDQELKNNSALQAKLDDTHNRLSTLVRQKRNELEKTINRIQMRVNPEGSQSNSLMSGAGGGSFCHGYKSMSTFEPEHATYDIDPENNEVSVNLATKDVLIDLIFLKDNNQSLFGYLSQLVLIWHQNKLPMHEFADLICQRLQKQIDGNPIIPGLTNAEAFNNGFKLFQYWELYFLHDFYNPETRKSVLNMLNLLKQLTDDEGDKDNISIYIENMSTKFETEAEAPDIPDIPYEPSKDVLDKSPKTGFSLPLRLDAKSMALHFMYIDLNNFQKIESYEYVKGAWGKPGREVNAKHINCLTAQFNKTAKMVLNTVLTAAAPNDKENVAAEKRARVIEAWIKIMEAAEQINNFILIFEIDAAFTNPAISKKRLPYTYEKVNKDLMAKREQLSGLTAPNNKFKAYKARLEKAPINKTLLYMGPWQTEMTFIDDGNKSSIPLPSGEDAINCKKQQAYFKQLSFLKKGWGKDMKFVLNKELLDEIVNYQLTYPDDTSLRKATADTKEFDRWKEKHP